MGLILNGKKYFENLFLVKFIYLFLAKIFFLQNIIKFSPETTKKKE